LLSLPLRDDLLRSLLWDGDRLEDRRGDLLSDRFFLFSLPLGGDLLGDRLKDLLRERLLSLPLRDDLLVSLP